MSNYKQIILDALVNVVSEPYYEVVHNMHEIALCHRLAVYLENSGKFTGYSIDCEYNRDEQATKRNPEREIFRPDIIVHVRGSNENNLIMIEAKKDPYSQKRKTKEKKRLKRNASERKYTHAFLVVFPKDYVKNDSVIEVQ